MQFRILLVTAVLISFSIDISAQQRIADNLKNRADTLYIHDEFAAASDLYKEAIELEMNKQEPRALFLGRCSESLGHCLYEAAELYESFRAFDDALRYYRKAGSQESVNRIIPEIAGMHALVKRYDLEIERETGVDRISIEIHFRVKEILESGGDSAVVLLDAGIYDGIFAGAKGEALGIYSEEYPDRGNEVLGRAEVVTVTSNRAKVIVKLTDANAPEGSIREGDMIRLPARVRKMGTISLIYDLSIMNIDFLTNAREPLYHVRQVVNSEDPELVNDILSIMKRDIIETADMIRPMIPDNPSWGEPLEAGRFKGISLVDAMEKVTTEDIFSFLRFVESFPGKYMGHSWKINETYATWIINGTPIGDKDLLDGLIASGNDQQFKELLETHYEDLEDGDFYANWQVEAEKLANQGRFTEANRINDVLFRIAETKHDTDLLGWAWFLKAQILQDDSKYEEAISSYSTAKKNFEKAGNTRGVSYATNNIALQYINLDRYNEALQNYTQSYGVKLERFRSDSSSLMKESIAITLEGMASAYYNLSQFDEALKMYSLSNEYYRSANTLDGLKGQAGNFKWMGRIHKKRGEYEEAIGYFREKERMHREMGDREGEADVLDDIAWLKYEIGEVRSAKEVYEQASRNKLELGDKDGAGFSMANVGQMLWTLGEYEQAIDAHKMGLQWRTEANNKAGQAYSYSKLGGIYGESGDPKTAIEYYNLALDIYDQVDDEKEMATVYKDLGTTYKGIQDNMLSEQCYLKALELLEKIGDRYEYASTLTLLGSLYTEDRRHELADSCFRLSLSIQHEIGDKPGSVYNYMNLGVVENYFTFDLKQAEEYYTLGYRVARETNNHSQVAYCKAAIGRMYSNRGDSQGLEMLEEARRAYAETGEKSKEIELLVDIGDHFFRQGELRTAEEYYGKALDRAKESNDRSSMARIYTSQGTLVHMQGDFTRALEIEEESFKISKEVENEWGMASSYLNFGNIYNDLGEFKKAIACYNLADSIYRDLRYDLSRASPINNIGTVFYWEGNYDSALVYFMKAHAIHVEAGAYPETIALLKTNIGEIYFEKKQYTESEKWLAESLSISRKGGFHRQTSNSLITLVKLNIDQDKYDDATRYLQECEQILTLTAEKKIECLMKYLLGKLQYRQENYRDAEVNLKKASEIAREMGSKKHLWKPLFTLSQVYKAEDNLDNAINTLTEAIEVIEYLKNKVTGGEEAMKIFASGEAKVKSYELMVEMLLQQGKTEEALTYLERGNSENLKSKFKEMEVTYADPTKNEALQKEKDLKKKVDIVSEEIQKERAKPSDQQNAGLLAKLEEIRTVAQSDYLSFVNQIIREQPTLRNHFSKSENPLHFRSQKRFIPDDVAVLLYLAAENNIYIFAGTCDSVFAKVVDMKKSKLEMKLYQLYSMLRKPGQIDPETGTSPFMDLSRELYSVLISPVEEEIRGKEKLAIIPNGMLYYLPFQVLIHSEGNDLHYLRDEYSIFYSNRLSYLTSPYLIDETYPRLLAIGNADETLPYAEVEVNQLKNIYPDSQVLLRSEATKQKVLSPNEEFNILHFATHGILDYNDFENSYLVLAADPTVGDDGRFRIDEIYGINNIDQYQMVTLSACETAVTMKMLEGWPITTASAFLEAGVPTVIASLWSVDDQATSILMEKFYENLQHMDKLEALHQAQQYLASIDKYKHPFFWAPFLLVGYWR